MEERSCCGRWIAVSESDDGIIIAAPIRCNSWRCRFCARRRKRKLLRRLQGSGPQTLLTLTCSNSRYPDPEAAFRHLSISVNRLFKRIRRRPGCSAVEYFLVWELTLAGWPHAHILLRAPYLPQRWLSDQWRDLTGSFIVDIRGVSTEAGAVNYVAKYLSKGPAAPYGFKRYRMSRGWLGHPDADPNAQPRERRRWTREGVTMEQFAAHLRTRGYVPTGDPDYQMSFTPLHVFLGRQLAPT